MRGSKAKRGAKARQGAKAKAPRRALLPEAAALVGKHREAGTCPSCGARASTFASLIQPGEEEIQFGCPSCSPLIAAAAAGAQQVREAQHRRN